MKKESKPWLCTVHHPWGNWVTYDRGNVTKPGTEFITGVVKFRRRECIRCGKTQHTQERVSV